MSGFAGVSSSYLKWKSSLLFMRHKPNYVFGFSLIYFEHGDVLVV